MGCASSTPADEGSVHGHKYVPSSAPTTPANGLAAISATTLATTVSQPPVAVPAAVKQAQQDAQLQAAVVALDLSQQDVTAASRATDAVKASSGLTAQGLPAAAVNSSLMSLNACSLSAVQETLLKVTTLMQKFAEGRSERTTPIQAIRRAVDLVAADAHANFASVQVLSDTIDTALLVALIGAPDHFLERHRLQRLGPGSGLAAEAFVINPQMELYTWSSGSPSQPPGDWLQLANGAGICFISAVPIRVQDKMLGILTLGFQEANVQYADHALWANYMQLVSAAMTSMVKDTTIPKYLGLVKELYQAADLDSLVHMVAHHMRGVLGHTHNHHTWYRLALTGSSNVAATIFDDLTQVPAPLMQRGLSSQGSCSSVRLLKEVQAAGGIMRTVVAMKSTVMKISVHNRQQVMIPDVQKLVNQSGNVSVDIFNTRLIKPPTSVLVFPLKVKQHIFGVVFCMSSVATDFSDVAPRLRELCEVLSPHLLTLLNTGLANDYSLILAATPAPTDGSSLSGLMLSHSRNASFSGRSMGDSQQGTATGGLNFSLLGSFQSQDSFVFTQSRSSTGALVTGLTEKLNQKRIKSSMDFAGNQALGDLQIQALLGEGGFAKVFRGLWRGLVVGIKVVCDDGKNEKMVMKNAHEIAILGALSHPNIVQAYTCLTDVSVHDLLTSSFRLAAPTVLSSQAYKYLAGMEERSCHIEVIEYCDLGNLSTALKYQVFQVPHPDKVFAAAVLMNGKEGSPDAATAAANPAAHANGTNGGAAASLLAEARGVTGGRVQMHTLLLTLIEIASAMAYLHRMGVVHCDIKPANVLLRSSNIDTRGFTVKVSDFGLSRVEDDDTHASFPFNSCGTAAYVAPEALICNKKVNSSVDVYAFGILMWEMYTGARPYGNMKQQQLVEEVVMRGLRPRFPSHAPPPYVLLAQACWSGSAQSRPTFEEALSTLNGMLTALDEKEMPSNPPAGSLASGDYVEYMAVNSAVQTAVQPTAAAAAAAVPSIPVYSGTNNLQDTANDATGADKAAALQQALGLRGGTAQYSSTSPAVSGTMKAGMVAASANGTSSTKLAQAARKPVVRQISDNKQGNGPLVRGPSGLSAMSPPLASPVAMAQ